MTLIFQLTIIEELGNKGWGKYLAIILDKNKDMRVSGPQFRLAKKEPDVVKLLYSKKQFEQHNISAAKPSILSTVLELPAHQIADTVQLATKTGSLTKPLLGEILHKLRHFGRYDIAEKVARSFQLTGRQLSSLHYNILMAHANDQGKWRDAVKLFMEASSNSCLNPKLHGTLLAAYRLQGSWMKCVGHFNQMCEDQIPMENHALHGILNTCRQIAPWQMSMKVFARSIEAGAKPNELVFLVLLRCLQQSPLPSRWHYALQILQQISSSGSLRPNAGMYNAVMDTLRTARRWLSAVTLFESMKGDGIQPNSRTMIALARLNNRDLNHVVQSLAQSHSLSIPVEGELYRMVLRRLLVDSTVDNAVALIECEIARGNRDPGNPNVSVRKLSEAMFDAILFHTKPKDSLRLLRRFEDEISSVLGLVTRGLGSLGTEEQRWIVEGRVAVIDDRALVHSRFETLINHYDGVIIPMTAVRIVWARTQSHLNNSAIGNYNRHVLTTLRERMFQENSELYMPMIKLMPLYHQLQSHTYLAGEDQWLTPTPLHVKNLRLTALQREKQLLASLEESADTIRIRDSTLTQSDPLSQPDPTSAAELGLPSERFFASHEKISVAESVLSVAAMLRHFNPNTSIHVVSPSRDVSSLVEKWNTRWVLSGSAGTPSVSTDRYRLESVWFPHELFERAPPPMPKKKANPKVSVQQDGNDRNLSIFVPH